MNRPNGGQSSHKPGDDRNPELPRRWLAVPAHVAWEFAVEMVARYSLRGVARMTGLGVETVRKFIKRIGDPNLATRRRFAELYLHHHAEGVVKQDDREKRWRSRPRLITMLEPGKEAARRELAKLFELAKRFPEEMPAQIDDLQYWMDLQVRAEYWAEEHFGAIARGEREHEPDSIFARKPGKKRKRRGEATDE
jgi:hypothetical protein